ncbi:MAG: hypothetical protein Q8N99_01545 [Nanoarchaeota archaeon]|nr:hypothetical protein [Nanoarchaeota archaeon]
MFNFQKNRIQKTIRCSCGNEAKQRIKRNYPFGRKSKCIKVTDYYCISCGKKQ